MPEGLPPVTARQRLRASDDQREVLRLIGEARLTFMAGRTVQPLGVGVSEFLAAHKFVHFDVTGAPGKVSHLVLFPGQPWGAHLE
jgi:hypothetical protein